MPACPNCYVSMSTQPVETFATRQAAEVDACIACRLLWFDHMESAGLTPRSVLGLFQYIGAAPQTAPTPLASRFNCPRCKSALAFTNDLQRTTRFTYWRCDARHGRLISFNQFLREKNFIRTPSPAELTRLRRVVRQVSCSQCGAPIDLANDSACTHCSAPISLVDPESIAKAIQELQGGRENATSRAETVSRQALSDAQIDALFAHERMRGRDETNDLLMIGAQAIGALVTAFLVSR